VDEVTQNGERLSLRMGERKVDGVANAETHAQMLRANDFHTKREARNVDDILCNTKHLTTRVRFGSNIFDWQLVT